MTLKQKIEHAIEMQLAEDVVKGEITAEGITKAVMAVVEPVVENLKRKDETLASELESRYFLGRDNSGHTYLVPELKRREWGVWCDIDEDDEASWNEPSWALRIEFHESLISFKDPLRFMAQLAPDKHTLERRYVRLDLPKA